MSAGKNLSWNVPCPTLKKLITQPKWKRYLAARSRSQQEANARFAEHKQKRNAARTGRQRPIDFRKLKTVRLAAPEIFSVIRNPSEVTSFLNRIRQLATTRENKVFVDLSDVKVITPDAIAALLATIHRQEVRNGFIYGNTPKDLRPGQVLNESGFRNYVRSTESGERATLGKIQKKPSSRNTFQSKFDQFVAQELGRVNTNVGPRRSERN